MQVGPPFLMLDSSLKPHRNFAHSCTMAFPNNTKKNNKKNPRMILLRVCCNVYNSLEKKPSFKIAIAKMIKRGLEHYLDCHISCPCQTYFSQNLQELLYITLVPHILLPYAQSPTRLLNQVYQN